jgi:hypothetical protein
MTDRRSTALTRSLMRVRNWANSSAGLMGDTELMCRFLWTVRLLLMRALRAANAGIPATADDPDITVRFEEPDGEDLRRLTVIPFYSHKTLSR